jgi:hypothetical protein
MTDYTSQHHYVQGYYIISYSNQNKRTIRNLRSKENKSQFVFIHRNDDYHNQSFILTDFRIYIYI